MALNDAAAFWNFDSSLTDSSGNGNTLSAVGSPDFTTGILGNALRSNTVTGGYAERNGLVVPSGSFSMGGFFFVTSTGSRTWMGLFEHAVGGLSLRTQFGLLFSLAGATGGVSNNAWNHLAVTYDDSTQESINYVNGVASAPASGAVSFPTGTTKTRVLADANGIEVAGNGLADLVFFYNRKLSASEVSQLYNAGVGLNPYGLQRQNHDGTGRPPNP